MKRNIPLLVFSILLSIVAFAIAIPTINYLHIRGLDPKDVGLNFITPYFKFQPSIDLQGGRYITLNADLTATDNTTTPQAEMDQIKSTLYYRFWNARIQDFSLNVINDNAQKINEIAVKAPGTVDQSMMQTLLSPANFSVWVQDPTLTDNSITTGSFESYLKQVFNGNYKMLNISNLDVTSSTVISDSRCYYQDATKPSNYCIDVIFDANAKTELGNAIRADAVPTAPIVLVLDYTPIGVKATGQVYTDASSLGSELLVYTGINDSLNNEIYASMIGSTPLNYNVQVDNIQTLSPTMGADTLLKIKIAMILSVMAANALMIYYFRRRGVVFTLSFILFLIWSIALMKITSMTLSFALIGGFTISSLVYISILIGTEYKIRTAFKGHLTADELKEIYSGVVSRVRNLAIVVVLIDFVAGYYATALIMNFVTGMGVALIGAMLVTITIFNAILPFLLLNKKHE